jgi:hypothetical protein
MLVFKDTAQLVESYQLIYRNIYHGGKIWMHQAIQKRVKWLYHKYGMTRQEIIEYLKWKFKGQKKHKTFDPEKSCLETYVLNFTYFALLSLVRQCKNQNVGSINEIPFSQLSDYEPVQRIGTSIESFDRLSIEGLMNERDPERIIIGKELMQMATEFFGEHDLAVTLGIVDKQAEADRLGLDYHTYRKRLQRKILRFRYLLNDNGYGID